MGLFATDEPRQGELLSSVPEPDEPAPFAGFLPRLFALLIDGVLLYAVSGMLVRGLRPAMLQLNPWLPWIGLGIVYGYFTAANGPVGRGRTLGKTVLGLHVVDRNGVSTGWRPALRRSLLHFLAVFGVIGLIPMLDMSTLLVALPPATRYAGLLLLTFFGLTGLTLAIVMALSLAIHPYKQSWHDQMAGSFVTRDPTPEVFRRTLAEPVEESRRRALANHLKMTIPFWLISFAVLGFGAFSQMLRGDMRVQIEHAARINRDVLADTPLELINLRYPSEEERAYLLDQENTMRERAAATGQEVPDFERLHAFFPGGEMIQSRIMVRRGSLPEGFTDDPEMLATAQRLREALWPLWLEYQQQWRDRTGSDIPEARKFYGEIVEPAQFIIHPGNRTVAIIHGDAAPTSAPLRLMTTEEFSAMLQNELGLSDDAGAAEDDTLTSPATPAVPAAPAAPPSPDDDAMTPTGELPTSPQP